MVGNIPDVSVIVPAYNEEGTISDVIYELLKIRSEFLSLEIIVVDDGSLDGTSRKASKFSSITLIKHPKNRGKGAALKTGFDAARGRVIVVQDADMEYAPCEIPHLIKPILAGEADVVYGSRLRGKPRGMSFSHFLGNVALSKVASLLYQKNVTDIMTGYKAFSRDAITAVDLKENGFCVEVELTATILKNGWTFQEVPIDYVYRSLGVSKIRNQDGLRSLLHLFTSALSKAETKNGKSHLAFERHKMYCLDKNLEKVKPISKELPITSN